nr:NADP-dependent malic enzyme-like [Physcomitrium patens]|eukprot:XP_024384458.1 NADP-dependent malic enzyme-like [Physcomitrella patens]
MECQLKMVCPRPDVLDLNNSKHDAGGGVGDTYCEDSATEDQTFIPWNQLVASGVDLLRDPRYNKGTAFSEGERDRHYLRGLLPPVVLTQERQIERILQNVRSYENNLEKYVDVMDLQVLVVLLNHGCS